MAPEITTRAFGESYMGLPADIFSLGVLLFIITFFAPPFTRAVPTDRNFGLFSKKPEFFWKMHPSVKKYQKKHGEVDQKLIDLLTSMLSTDINSRPSNIKEVLEHPFF